MDTQQFWHATIGIFLIGIALSSFAFIIYLLFGPGWNIVIPDYLGLLESTTTRSATSAPLQKLPALGLTMVLLSHYGRREYSR